MIRAAIAVILAGLVTGACTYHNTVYNARALYLEAQELRRAGQDSLALERYREVADKTRAAEGAKPEAVWAAESLVLLGASELRLGHLAPAGAALEEVLRRTGDPWVRTEARLLLARLSTLVGEVDRALRQINIALEGALRDESRGEAHLLRAQLLLDAGRTEQGLWDLDRAADVGEGLRVEAGVERLAWAVRSADLERTGQALSVLFADRIADVRVDTVLSLARQAGDRWGSGPVADHLGAVEASDWRRPARARVLLERARLLRRAGREEDAFRQAREITAGLGSDAAEARLLIADWRLESALDLGDVTAVRPLLLPSADDPAVRNRLESIGRFEAFVEEGLEDPLSLFAAAESARDGLGAFGVARGLFMAYAAGAPLQPWAPKALLAAAAVTSDPGERAWLLGRLEAYPRSPYVLAAFGGSSSGLDALEETLAVRLREIGRR